MALFPPKHNLNPAHLVLASNKCIHSEMTDMTDTPKICI